MRKDTIELTEPQRAAALCNRAYLADASAAAALCDQAPLANASAAADVCDRACHVSTVPKAEVLSKVSNNKTLPMRKDTTKLKSLLLDFMAVVIIFGTFYALMLVGYGLEAEDPKKGASTQETKILGGY